MAIEVQGVSKRFGDFTALDDVSLTVRDGSLTALLGPSGGGKSTLLRVIAGLEQPDSGVVRIGGEDITASRPGTRRRLRLPALRRVQAHDRARQRRVRPDDPQAPEGRDRRPGAGAAQARAPRRVRPPVPEPAVGRPAPAHGARPRARGPAQGALLDEPFGALDANVRKELREWLRRLHEEVHVTTIFVTHDQEEAMEVAEQIAVINKGGIEQAGSPDDLYERPANRFVMGFVGPVAELDGQLVRPHDVTLLEEAEDGARQAIVERVIRVGFEVRVELALGEGEPLTAQLSRSEAEPLDLHDGQIVWVRAERVRELA
jgi:sulfate transport system ATP-binding protein